MARRRVQKRVTVPSRFVAQRRNKPLRFVSAGLGLLGAIILVAGVVRFPQRPLFHDAVAPGLGACLLVAAAWLWFTRTDYHLDADGSTLIRAQGVPNYDRRLELLVADVRSVTLNAVTINQGFASERRYQLALERQQKPAVVVESFNDLEFAEARAMATALATALQRDLLDTTSGKPVLTPLTELDRSLHDRWRDADRLPAEPEALGAPRCWVASAPGHSTVVIPGPGPRLYFANLAQVAVFAVLCVQFYRAVVDLGAPVLTGEAAPHPLSWIVGASLLVFTAFLGAALVYCWLGDAWRSTTVEIGHGTLSARERLPYRLGSVSVALKDVLAIEFVLASPEHSLDLIAVQVLHRGGAFRLGDGLVPDEVRWLSQFLEHKVVALGS